MNTSPFVAEVLLTCLAQYPLEPGLIRTRSAAGKDVGIVLPAGRVVPSRHHGPEASIARRRPCHVVQGGSGVVEHVSIEPRVQHAIRLKPGRPRLVRRELHGGVESPVVAGSRRRD